MDPGSALINCVIFCVALGNLVRNTYTNFLGKAGHEEKEDEVDSRWVFCNFERINMFNVTADSPKGKKKQQKSTGSFQNHEVASCKTKRFIRKDDLYLHPF